MFEGKIDLAHDIEYFTGKYEDRIGKMHRNKHLKQNISQGKERESLIMFSFFGRIQWIPPVKIGILGPRVQGIVLPFE